jgi:hypothetical protein
MKCRTVAIHARISAAAQKMRDKRARVPLYGSHRHPEREHVRASVDISSLLNETAVTDILAEVGLLNPHLARVNGTDHGEPLNGATFRPFGQREAPPHPCDRPTTPL